jgi:LacI family transcriptional regulator
MATLKDIAKHLGLSTTTVSRALNDFPEVGRDTRELVQRTAQELGYHPNQSARKLVTGKSGIVAMVIKAPPNRQIDPSFFEVMGGLSTKLAEKDIDLILHVTTGQDPIKPYQRLIDKQTVDGFILNAPLENDPRIDFLRERNFPFVVHGRAGGEADYPYYDIDNYGIGYSATKLLLDLGHQQIGLLNGPLQAAFAVERLRGYTDAMEARGLSPNPEFLRHLDIHQPQSAINIAGELLERPKRPTALLCSSSLIAYSAVKVAKLEGIPIPQQLSLIAHDDDLPFQSALLEPSLTVTRSPLRRACGPLSEMIFKLLEGDDPALLQQTEPVELVVCDSTGPAPS